MNYFTSSRPPSAPEDSCPLPLSFPRSLFGVSFSGEVSRSFRSVPPNRCTRKKRRGRSADSLKKEPSPSLVVDFQLNSREAVRAPRRLRAPAAHARPGPPSVGSAAARSPPARPPDARAGNVGGPGGPSLAIRWRLAAYWDFTHANSHAW